MIHGDQEGWRVHSWIDSAKKILEKAMTSPGKAREEAVELLNDLGRRGYTELGQLLKK
jgi:hypothetical protein